MSLTDAACIGQVNQWRIRISVVFSASASTQQALIYLCWLMGDSGTKSSTWCALKQPHYSSINLREKKQWNCGTHAGVGCACFNFPQLQKSIICRISRIHHDIFCCKTNSCQIHAPPFIHYPPYIGVNFQCTSGKYSLVEFDRKMMLLMMMMIRGQA